MKKRIPVDAVLAILLMLLVVFLLVLNIRLHQENAALKELSSREPVCARVGDGYKH